MLPDHLRALKRELAGDGGGVQGRDAACGPLLVCDEFGGVAAGAVRDADAGEYGTVCPRPSRDEH